MKRLFAAYRDTKQLASRREQRNIRETARSIAWQEIETSGFAKCKDDTERRAFLRGRVREGLQRDPRYGSPLVSWLMFWAIGKLLDLVIAMWAKRHAKDVEVGHA